MDTALLATKLLIPPVRRDHIARSRPDLPLAEILHCPITLISAPPGSGKTTLLSAWLRQLPQQAEGAAELHIGWVTLDSEDNDPLRFWSYIAAAYPEIERTTGLASLLSAPSMELVFVKALINTLITVQEPIILVLDDYHLIQDAAVHNSLLYLLEHIPDNLHVVICSRMDPPLPLGRWRVGGQLTEIRSANLRFTQAEATAFLEVQTGIRLLPEQLAEVEQRTEGWAAGLQMVALSLKNQPLQTLDQRISGFSGRHRFILDYLTDEVLNRQPLVVQQFLQITSILKRISAPLCTALLAEAGSQDVDSQAMDAQAMDAQAMLVKLERDNLFLVGLDEDRTWYRYHHLFGDLLQAKLREEITPERLAGLYRRAAEWHHAQGWMSEAVSYALAAHDPSLAADLLSEAVQRVEVWSRGDIRTVLGWIKALPPETISARPWLRLYLSRALFVSGRLKDAEAILDQLDAQDVREDEHLAGHLAGSRARIAAVRGELRRAEQSARLALAALPSSAVLARSSAASSLGYTLLLKGDLAESLRWMTRAYQEAQANGFRLLALNVLANIAWAHLIQGQISPAEQAIEEGLQQGTIAGQRLPAAGLVLILRAERLYDRGDLAAAEQTLREGVTLLAQGGIEDSSQMGNIFLARLRHAQNDPEGAVQAIERAVEQAKQSGIERSQRSAEAFQAQMWLWQGNLRAAQDWAARYQALNAVEYLHETEDLILARVLLAAGDANAALAICHSVRVEAEAGGRMRRVLEALLVQALAFSALNRADSAQAALLQSLVLADAQGVRQVFIQEGEKLRLLLSAAARRGVSIGLLSELLEETVPAIHPAGDLRQPLSEREGEVLRLLAEGLSNREIAARLTVAETTVKKHINHIFDKLDVANRTQALIRARELVQSGTIPSAVIRRVRPSD